MSMSEMPIRPPSPEKFDKLHQRVEALLDTPVARESEAWPLPVEESIKDVGAGYEPQQAQEDKPAPL